MSTSYGRLCRQNTVISSDFCGLVNLVSNGESPMSRSINCIGTQVEYNDNSNFHDFDCALAHTGLVEDLITERAIK